MKRNFEKGITLVALVITIIVLVILAGVGINLILGENGIIQRAQSAKQIQEQAEAKEKLEFAISELTIEKSKQNKQIQLEDLIELNNKNNIVVKTEEDTGKIEIINNSVTVYVNRYEFKVDRNFNIISVGKNNEISTDNPVEEPEIEPKEYVQDGLIVWYDGINNTKEGHSDTTTIWENLAPISDQNPLERGHRRNLPQHSKGHT